MHLVVFLLPDQFWIELLLHPALVFPSVGLVETVLLLILVELTWEDNASFWTSSLEVSWLASNCHFFEVGVKALGSSVVYRILCTLHAILSRPILHLVLVLEVLVDLVSDQSLVFCLEVLDQFLFLCFLGSHHRVSELVLLLSDEGNSHLVDLGMLVGEGLAVGDEVSLDRRVELSPSQMLVDLVSLVIQFDLVLAASSVPDVLFVLFSVLSDDGPLLIPSWFRSSILVEVTVLVRLLHDKTLHILILNKFVCRVVQVLMLHLCLNDVGLTNVLGLS